MRRLTEKLVERLIVRKRVVSGGASGRRARPLISGDASAWQPVAALPSGWLMVTIKGGETLNGFSLPLRVSAGRLVLISWQRPSFLSPAPPIKFLPFLFFFFFFERRRRKLAILVTLIKLKCGKVKIRQTWTRRAAAAESGSHKNRMLKSGCFHVVECLLQSAEEALHCV